MQSTLVRSYHVVCYVSWTICNTCTFSLHASRYMRNCVYASALHPSVTHAQVKYYGSMYERRIHGAVASAIAAFLFLAMSTQVKRQRSSSDGEDSVDDNHIRAGLQESFQRMSTQSDIAQLLVEKRILRGRRSRSRRSTQKWRKRYLRWQRHMMRW